MSGGGPLPPVPDLIPISALRKSGGGEVMGEQRRPNHADLIDSVAHPPARTGGRRRQHRRKASRRRRHSSKSRRSRSPPPRVNPIFVWARQEDARIVDVKCEDYDKRNRILLTKTAQGWRAIPRTETLAPSLKDAANNDDQHHHHHHHRKSASRKTKVRRRSTAVQVTSDLEAEDPEEQLTEAVEQDQESSEPPSWISADNVNVESLLPSHTIEVKKQPANVTSSQPSNVNSSDATCDVTPLENLLAVAELEFNHQIRLGEWDKPEESNENMITSYDNDEENQKNFIENLDHLDELMEKKSVECDYTEDDENNLAMDDILTRLEQSLRSPENTNIDVAITKNTDRYISDKENTSQSVPEIERYFEKSDPEPEESKPEVPVEEEKLEETVNIVESSTVDDEEPTDLSLKPTIDDGNIEDDVEDCDFSEEPTDLTIPKISPKLVISPRPPSQNSEAIQSPQPSGIPAVPQSPDIVSTTVTATGKSKSIFLESLLSNTSKKILLNSEVTITRQKEPLDLGKCHRKSASPTVTCSEEINSGVDMEPPIKKFKSVDITLKNLLDESNINNGVKSIEKTPTNETPRLLELLKNDSDPDPLTQLKQLLADPSVNIPDPMLVPKDKFSIILTRPGSEIPKLLKERPELRLPEALAYPHIMQDPNMLVLNIHHLESILSNKIAQENSEKERENQQEKLSKKIECSKSETGETQNTMKRKVAENVSKSTDPQKCFTELANDIDAATQAAFSQMVWLPYLNHLEAMSHSGNADLMKMLSNSLQSFPLYQNQMSEFSHMFETNRFPCSPIGFPMPPPMNYGNPMEMGMWQEAMMQANMLRNKNSFDNFNNKHMFKDYLEKINAPQIKKPSLPTAVNSRMHLPNKQPSFPSGYYSNGPSPYQNTYMNMSNSFPSKSSLPSGSQKNHCHQQKSSYSHKHPSSYHQQQRLENNQNFGSSMYPGEHHYLQGLNALNNQEQYHQPTSASRKDGNVNSQKPKLSCKPFANISQKNNESTKNAKTTTSQPIDLSGATNPAATGKVKVKQHLIDPANAPKLLKHHEDIPEVGSTTASIEEMQDAHKHLWHPLFGNQKGYNSPWNWTTVTATGE